MKALAIALIALAVSAAASSAAEEKLVPVIDAGFASLLLGCWDNGWHAQLADGTEASETSSICFENSTLLSISYAYDGADSFSAKGAGTYEFANNRLTLSYEEKPQAWPFPGKKIDCDAVVRSNSELQLKNCTAHGPVAANKEYDFYRPTE